MGILTFLGIYPEEIENAADVFETVLRKEGYDVTEIDEKWTEVSDYLAETLAQADLNQTHLTNVIMDAMYYILQGVVQTLHPGKNVSYYINGQDTHFVIDGEEVYAEDE